METWKQIPGWEGIYDVSSFGAIKRIAAATGATVGAILKPIKLVDGYYGVRLRSKGRTVRPTIHSLVLLAFVGDRPHKIEINHIDGNKANNSLQNLEYCTSSENKLHSYNTLNRIRKGAKGESNYHSKLSAMNVAQIRSIYNAGGRTQQSIADDFKITQNMVSKIVLRQFWKHID